MGALGGANRLLANTHCVGEVELHFADLADSDLNINNILEGRGAFVAALDGNHGRENALGLNLVEAIAKLVEVGHASLLHETNIVGMVRHAHPVTFVIFHFVLEGKHIQDFV